MKNNFILFSLLILFVSCKESEARRPILQKTTNNYQQLVVNNKSLNKLEEKKINDLIVKDSTHIYYTSPNGFWYFYNKKITKDTITPKINDIVSLKYSITDLEGNIIYSEKELGLKSYVVDKEDFITALQTGIKLMHKGETITFVIPSYNAFGITGDGNRIGVNQSIISKVTLIDIIKTSKK